MQERVLSIAEIAQIEAGYTIGAPTLGFAAAALLARWQFGLRYEETLLRLVFLRWYSLIEPPFLTGLGDFGETVDAETLITEFGGDASLSDEGRFIIGILGHGPFAFGLGEEEAWRERARTFFRAAAVSGSMLFADWNFLIGEAKESLNLKSKIGLEIHARFYGRGYMGEYMVHILTGMLRSGLN
jgi:hypothetical protein